MLTLEKLIAKVLDVDDALITDESGPDSIESWDSFNALLLIAEMEKNFNTKFTIEEIGGVKTVADIKKVLKERGLIQ